MSSWGDVLKIQNNVNITEEFNQTTWENSTYYDIRFINGSYTDNETAEQLKLTINETCDEQCQKKGCAWSVIYGLAGWTLILIAINAGLLILGAWFYKPRMIGLFCHHFLLIFNIASVVVTFKFRYRDQGKLAAMSIMPSRPLNDTAFDPDWTYEDDANYIDKIFIWQCITLFLCLITSNFGCSKMFNSKYSLKDSQVASSFMNSTTKRSMSNRAPDLSQSAEAEPALLNPNN